MHMEMKVRQAVLLEPGKECVADEFPRTQPGGVVGAGLAPVGCVKSGRKSPGRKPPLTDLLQQMLPWLLLTPGEEESGSALGCG